MNEKAASVFYDLWVESEGYRAQSALENGFLGQKIEEVLSITAPEKIREISDYMVHVACETEIRAFEHGFRYGILFMLETIKGGSI